MEKPTDFLAKKDKKINKRIWKKTVIITLSVIVILAIPCLIYYPSAQSTYKYALSAKDDLYKAQGAIGARDFIGAKKALSSAQEKFTDAKNKFNKLKMFGFIPVIGTQIAAVDNLLIAGIDLSSGFQDLAQLGETVFSPIENKKTASLAEITSEEKGEILEKMYQSPPLLQGAKAEIDLAFQAIENIPDKGLLGPIKNVVKPLKEQMPVIKKSIELAIPASEAIPQIAGYPYEKTYLFLLQNNTEMRPTGGFIGTYGIIKMKNGEITYFKTDNIYNLDNKVSDQLIEAPPDPLIKYLSADKWFMRDSNWSPDFPTAAQKAEWFYHKEGGSENNISGVIAVTPTFIQSLLAVTGEMEINGIKFNSDNLVDALEYQVEQGFNRQGISDADRKEIIGDLASKIMEEILKLPSNRWGELWTTFEKDITSKQILVYLKDDNVEQLVKTQGWAGEVKQTEADYFMAIDANMASLKSDPGVIRTINYEVNEESNGEMIGKLNIHYDNQGTFNWKSTRYRTYTRVYVPLGSELIEAQGVMDNDKLHGGRKGTAIVTEENGKTCFGAFISIEPQEQGDLVFTYKLPANIAEMLKNKKYELYAQKQPGTPGYTLNVSLEFKEKISSFIPIDKGRQDGQNKITFNTDLLEDREILINFK